MISDATWSIATTDQGHRTSSRCTQRLSSEAISNVFGQFRFLDHFVLAVCSYLNVRQIFTEVAEPMARGQIPDHGKTGGTYFYRAHTPSTGDATMHALARFGPWSRHTPFMTELLPALNAC